MWARSVGCNGWPLAYRWKHLVHQKCSFLLQIVAVERTSVEFLPRTSAIRFDLQRYSTTCYANYRSMLSKWIPPAVRVRRNNNYQANKNEALDVPNLPSSIKNASVCRLENPCDSTVDAKKNPTLQKSSSCCEFGISKRHLSSITNAIPMQIWPRADFARMRKAWTHYLPEEKWFQEGYGRTSRRDREKL